MSRPYSTVTASTGESNNVNGEECKKLMTQDIFAEVSRLSSEDKEILRKKNTEANAKFSQLVESNVAKFASIAKIL